MMTNRYCWHGSGIDEKYCWKGSRTDEKIFLKWKRDWWKNIAEMEAGLMKKYCWHGSGIAEKILLKWKRDWWKNISEMEEGLMEKYCWNGSGIDEKGGIISFLGNFSLVQYCSCTCWWMLYCSNFQSVMAVIIDMWHLFKCDPVF